MEPTICKARRLVRRAGYSIQNTSVCEHYFVSESLPCCNEELSLFSLEQRLRYLNDDFFKADVSKLGLNHLLHEKEDVTNELGKKLRLQIFSEQIFRNISVNHIPRVTKKRRREQRHPPSRSIRNPPARNEVFLQQSGIHNLLAGGQIQHPTFQIN